MSAFKIPRGPIHEPPAMKMIDAPPPFCAACDDTGLLIGTLCGCANCNGINPRRKPIDAAAAGIHPSWLP